MLDHSSDVTRQWDEMSQSSLRAKPTLKDNASMAVSFSKRRGPSDFVTSSDQLDGALGKITMRG